MRGLSFFFPCIFFFLQWIQGRFSEFAEGQLSQLPPPTRRRRPSAGIAIFRCVRRFVLQFGIHGNPSLNDATKAAYHRIDDDRAKMSNRFGWLTFAAAGPGTRTTQMFFNLRNNNGLDSQGFAPIARCVQGCDVLREINTEYSERPRQNLIRKNGNAYLNREFPNMDYITSAAIVEAPANVPGLNADGSSAFPTVGDVGDAGLDLGIITKKLRVTKDKLVTLGGIKTIGAEADLLRSQIGEFRSQRRRILDERIRQERSKKVMGLVFKTAQTPATTLRPA